MTATSPGLPVYVDSSMLSTWRACRRKFFWSTVNALYPTGRSVHLIAGAAFAAGMEAARRCAFTSSSDTSIEQLLEAAFPVFVREWGDYDAPEGSAKTFVNTFSALGDYLEKYHPLRDSVQPHIKKDGSPAVEFTFAIPLDDPEYPRHPSGDCFIFVGRFDMLGYFGPERLPVILDEKTTSSIGFAWEDQWSLRGQFIGYVWALQQLGFDIQHACVRGIAINKTQYKTATALPMYPHHTVENWRVQLVRDLHDITTTYNAWTSRRVRQVSEGRRQTLLEGPWDMNLADACSSYGGCAFTTLCSAKRAEPFFTNYVLHRWDPLSRNPVIELHPTARPVGEEPLSEQSGMGEERSDRSSDPPTPPEAALAQEAGTSLDGDDKCKTCDPAPLASSLEPQPSALELHPQ